LNADKVGLLPFGLALAGSVIGVGILFFEPLAHAAGSLVGLRLSQDFTQAEWKFVKRDQTILWLFLLCAQTALWATLLGPIMRTLRELRPWHRRTTALLGAGGFIIAFGVLYVATRALGTPDYPLPGHAIKLTLLTSLAGIVAYLGALGIWRVDRAATDLALYASALHEPTGERPAATGRGNQRLIDRYLDLRNALDRLLIYMGAIVSAAVLATGALRNAVISWHTNSHIPSNEIFSQEHVLVYGLFLSGLLALVYLPPYQRLRALGIRLRDALCPPLWPPNPDWRARAEERATLGDLLRLEVTGTASLRAGIAILAPLASSLVSRLLGG
jgi:hypothetical protein